MKRYKNKHGAVTVFHRAGEFVVQVICGGKLLEDTCASGTAAMRTYHYWRKRLQGGRA